MKLDDLISQYKKTLNNSLLGKILREALKSISDGLEIHFYDNSGVFHDENDSVNDFLRCECFLESIESKKNELKNMKIFERYKCFDISKVNSTTLADFENELFEDIKLITHFYDEKGSTISEFFGNKTANKEKTEIIEKNSNEINIENNISSLKSNKNEVSFTNIENIDDTHSSSHIIKVSNESVESSNSIIAKENIFRYMNFQKDMSKSIIRKNSNYGYENDDNSLMNVYTTSNRYLDPYILYIIKSINQLESSKKACKKCLERRLDSKNLYYFKKICDNTITFKDKITPFFESLNLDSFGCMNVLIKANSFLKKQNDEIYFLIDKCKTIQQGQKNINLDCLNPSNIFCEEFLKALKQHLNEIPREIIDNELIKDEINESNFLNEESDCSNEIKESDSKNQANINIDLDKPISKKYLIEDIDFELIKKRESILAHSLSRIISNTLKYRAGDGILSIVRLAYKSDCSILFGLVDHYDRIDYKIEIILSILKVEKNRIICPANKFTAKKYKELFLKIEKHIYKSVRGIEKKIDSNNHEELKMDYYNNLERNFLDGINQNNFLDSFFQNKTLNIKQFFHAANDNTCVNKGVNNYKICEYPLKKCALEEFYDEFANYIEQCKNLIIEMFEKGIDKQEEFEFLSKCISSFMEIKFDCELFNIYQSFRLMLNTDYYCSVAHKISQSVNHKSHIENLTNQIADVLIKISFTDHFKLKKDHTLDEPLQNNCSRSSTFDCKPCNTPQGSDCCCMYDNLKYIISMVDCTGNLKHIKEGQNNIFSEDFKKIPKIECYFQNDDNFKFKLEKDVSPDVVDSKVKFVKYFTDLFTDYPKQMMKNKHIFKDVNISNYMYDKFMEHICKSLITDFDSNSRKSIIKKKHGDEKIKSIDCKSTENFNLSCFEKNSINSDSIEQKPLNTPIENNYIEQKSDLKQQLKNSNFIFNNESSTNENEIITESLANCDESKENISSFKKNSSIIDKSAVLFEKTAFEQKEILQEKSIKSEVLFPTQHENENINNTIYTKDSVINKNIMETPPTCDINTLSDNVTDHNNYDKNAFEMVSKHENNNTNNRDIKNINIFNENINSNQPENSDINENYNSNKSTKTLNAPIRLENNETKSLEEIKSDNFINLNPHSDAFEDNKINKNIMNSICKPFSTDITRNLYKRANMNIIGFENGYESKNTFYSVGSEENETTDYINMKNSTKKNNILNINKENIKDAYKNYNLVSNYGDEYDSNSSDMSEDWEISGESEISSDGENFDHQDLNISEKNENRRKSSCSDIENSYLSKIIDPSFQLDSFSLSSSEPFEFPFTPKAISDKIITNDEMNKFQEDDYSIHLFKNIINGEISNGWEDILNQYKYFYKFNKCEESLKLFFMLANKGTRNKINLLENIGQICIDTAYWENQNLKKHKLMSQLNNLFLKKRKFTKKITKLEKFKKKINNEMATMDTSKKNDFYMINKNQQHFKSGDTHFEILRNSLDNLTISKDMKIDFNKLATPTSEKSSSNLDVISDIENKNNDQNTVNLQAFNNNNNNQKQQSKRNSIGSLYRMDPFDFQTLKINSHVKNVKEAYESRLSTNEFDIKKTDVCLNIFKIDEKPNDRTDVEKKLENKKGCEINANTLDLDLNHCENSNLNSDKKLNSSISDNETKVISHDQDISNLHDIVPYIYTESEGYQESKRIKQISDEENINNNLDLEKNIDRENFTLVNLNHSFSHSPKENIQSTKFDKFIENNKEELSELHFLKEHDLNPIINKNISKTSQITMKITKLNQKIDFIEESLKLLDLKMKSLSFVEKKFDCNIEKTINFMYDYTIGVPIKLCLYLLITRMSMSKSESKNIAKNYDTIISLIDFYCNINKNENLFNSNFKKKILSNMMDKSLDWRSRKEIVKSTYDIETIEILSHDKVFFVRQFAHELLRKFQKK
ncbi:hypothetical protein EDEG_00540 [Edhazardia aedis USNM 41457]|uniref:Uncharacterized protein n=1 Tax=Edhazardia aedis (strain USNM 41457) TaxID=1003232 RepID=J9DF61_EDHAE|nr:hypothetical protein EDEG_00540 [Edhazardia aedis USNM 41457]|eukprot:EJW01240.1 hypothetical protein EDEG_00540 [Edhazardia aedis USNM 41457]